MAEHEGAEPLKRRKANFDAKVSIKFDDWYGVDLVAMDATTNGQQWFGVTYTREEWGIIIDKLQRALRAT